MEFDNWIANKTIDSFDCILKYVHPNILTIVGIVINIIIAFFYKRMDFLLVSILLFTRYLMDALDGNVARRYNKSSSIGGTLDSISDLMLYYISVFIIAKIYKLNVLLCMTLLTIVIFIAEKRYSFITGDHSSLKSKDKMTTFFVNNTIIFYILFLVILYINTKNVLSTSKKTR